VPALDSTIPDAPLNLGARAAPVPALIVAHHPDPRFLDVTRRLRPGERLTLGRGEAALGPGGLDGGGISRRHAALSYRDGILSVRDLESRNGTWVNGQRVESSQLRPGDVLRVGDVLAVIQWTPRVRADRPRRPEGMVAISGAMDRALALVDEVAPLASAALVLGETGVGKEGIVRALHRRSGRGGRFVAVNCGALDDALLRSELFGHVRGAFSGADADRRGLIEAADGGTLFLDEIGEAGAALQTSLLRVLQEGELRRVGSDRVIRVDTRFVAATHRDLEAEVEAERFREDLYARLARWEIRIPPLRERREDILPLARHFAARAAERPVSPSRPLAAALLLYAWPRNVRELESVMERVVVTQRGEAVLEWTDALAAQLPLPAPHQATPGERPGPEALRARLKALGGNVKTCADELGVSRNTLYRWIRQAGIDVSSLREG